MATRLHGILLDGLNNPIINATVALIAKGNTITVLNGSEAIFRTDGEGAYNVTVQTGHYKVIIGPQGIEPYKAGEIVIYGDSPEGSLNGYLINWAPEELTPDVIKQVQQLVANSEEYALQAGRSAAAANADATDARNSKASAAQSASDALVYKNDAKASEDAAKQAQAGAAGSANTATQAVTTIQGLKSDVEQLKVETTTLKDAAAASAAQASNSATEAGQQASNAAGSAQSASTDAGRAEVAAGKAEGIIGKSLLKENNLSDLSDINIARQNLRLHAFDSVGGHTFIYSPDGNYRIVLRNGDGLFIVQTSDGATTKPILIGAGGTGADNITDAKKNLEIASFKSADEQSLMYSPDISKYAIFIKDNGDWGCLTMSDGERHPLAIEAGGTGGKDIKSARVNLQLGKTDEQYFGNVHVETEQSGVASPQYFAETADGRSRFYHEKDSAGNQKTVIETVKKDSVNGDKSSWLSYDNNAYLSGINILQVNQYLKCLGSIEATAGATIGLLPTGTSGDTSIKLWNLPNDGNPYTWINRLQGNWYASTYMFGGIRGGGVNLEGVKLYLDDSQGKQAEFTFNPETPNESWSGNITSQRGFIGRCRQAGWGADNDFVNVPYFANQISNNDGGFAPIVSGATASSVGYSMRVTLGAISNGTQAWPDGVISLTGDSAHKRVFLFQSPGSIYTWGSEGFNTGNYDFAKNPTSDRDLKKDIIYTDGKESYERVMQWLPTMFKYKGSDIQRYGLIAQDLNKIDNQYVKIVPGSPIFEDVIGVNEDGEEYVHHQIETGRNDDTLALDSNVVLTDLACAFRYQADKVNKLEQELTELKKLVNKLVNPDNLP